MVAKAAKAAMVVKAAMVAMAVMAAGARARARNVMADRECHRDGHSMHMCHGGSLPMRTGMCSLFTTSMQLTLAHLNSNGQISEVYQLRALLVSCIQRRPYYRLSQ